MTQSACGPKAALGATAASPPTGYAGRPV